ncbi:hypothetical protein GCM10009727_63200 [Actinomadura napierensis]|uniref:PH domain-containing protein n=1 Tax=Actinomadura napierensis TaxID=267854 RepID=A0ABN3A7G5_9ACTN
MSILAVKGGREMACEHKLQKSYRPALVSFWTTGAVLIVAMVTAAGVAISVADLIFLVLALPFAFNAWRFHRESVEREHDGVLLRRMRSRRILWSQVSELKIGQGVTGRRVVVMLRSGRTVALPVPRDLGPLKERAFGEKAATLVSWHRESQARL